MQTKKTIAYLNRLYKNVLIKCFMAGIVAMSFTGNANAFDIYDFDDLAQNISHWDQLNILNDITDWKNKLEITVDGGAQMLNNDEKSITFDGGNNTLNGIETGSANKRLYTTDISFKNFMTALSVTDSGSLNINVTKGITKFENNTTAIHNNGTVHIAVLNGSVLYIQNDITGDGYSNTININSEYSSKQNKSLIMVDSIISDNDLNLGSGHLSFADGVTKEHFSDGDLVSSDGSAIYLDADLQNGNFDTINSANEDIRGDIAFRILSEASNETTAATLFPNAVPSNCEYTNAYTNEALYIYFGTNFAKNTTSGGLENAVNDSNSRTFSLTNDYDSSGGLSFDDSGVLTIFGNVDDATAENLELSTIYSINATARFMDVGSNATLNVIDTHIMGGSEYGIQNKGTTTFYNSVYQKMADTAIINEGTLLVNNSTFNDANIAIDNKGTLTIYDTIFKDIDYTAIKTTADINIYATKDGGIMADQNAIATNGADIDLYFQLSKDVTYTIGNDISATDAYNLTIKGNGESIFNLNGDAENIGKLTADYVGLAIAGTDTLHISVQADELTLSNDTFLNIDYANVDVNTLNAIDKTITNNGRLAIGDGTDIGNLFGAGYLFIKGNSNVDIGMLNGQSVEISANSILNLTSETKLYSLNGSGLLSIGNGGDGLGLTVAAGSSSVNGPSLKADTLVLQSGASAFFDNIAVNTITIEGELATDASRLFGKSTSNYAGTGNAITLDISDAIASSGFVTGIDGVAQIYYVYNQAGVNWGSFELSDTSKTAINTRVYQGNDVLLTTTDDNLTLTMQESTDRLWKVSDNFALSAGSAGADLSVLKPIYDDVTGKMKSYDILDTVDRVYVDKDFTIDLVGVDSAPSNQPLLIQNLSGDEGKTLTIVGDGVDQDKVALRNVAESFALNDMMVKDITLTAQIFSDGSKTNLFLANLTLDNSVFNVISPAGSGSVLGAPTDVYVSQLNSINGSGSSKVMGDFFINGDGGVYNGIYEDAVINATNGANQTLKADFGLTLAGDAGILKVSDAVGGTIDRIKTTGANLVFDYSDSTDVRDVLTLIENSSMVGGSLTVTLNADFIEQGAVQNIFAGNTLSLDGTKIYVDGSLTDPTREDLNIKNLGTEDIELAVLHHSLTATDTEVSFVGPLMARYFANGEIVNGSIIADIRQDAFNNVGQSLGVASGTLKSQLGAAKAIASHLGSVTSDGENTPSGDTGGENKLEDISMWVMPLFNHTTIDGFKGTGSKSDASMYMGGIALGADKLTDDDYRLGFAFNVGFGKTEAEGVTDSENDFNFYGMSLYGSKDIDDVKVIADAGITFIQNDMTEDLSIYGSPNAQGEADSHAISIGVVAEKTFDKETFKYTPYAGLRYTHLHTDSYSLQNASGVLSSTESDSQNIIQIPVGVMFEKQIENFNEWSMKPKAKAGIVVSFGDLEANSDSIITGFSDIQSYQMDNVDTLAFDGGIGLEMQKDNVTIDFGYNLLASPHEYSHTISANIKWDF